MSRASTKRAARSRATRSVFSLAEREAWAPPPQLTVTQWADEYRIMGPRAGALPGKYDSSLTPYVRGIQDALSDSEHTVVVLMKSVQSSGSTCGENAIGYWAHVAPGPILVVYPTEQATRAAITERLIPLFKHTPQLAALLGERKWDLRRDQIRLSTCSVHAGWSGSPQAMASRPIRYAINEETDKYPGWDGKEADPISLTRDRLTTYGDRAKHFVLSTPTTERGPIARAFAECRDRRRWWIPCPRCGVLHRFCWEQFRWEEQDVTEARDMRRVADEIEAEQLRVWCVCSECGAELEEREVERAHQHGEWVSEGCAPGEHPRSKRVAFHVWAGMSPFVGWPALVAEFLRSKASGLGQWQNFVNNFLGEPFSDSEASFEFSLFEEKGKKHKAGIVPTWASVVIATADTGRDRFHYMVRAWGSDYQSRLLDYGEVATFEELEQRALYRRWKIEGTEAEVAARFILIDAAGGSNRDGSRTDQVLRWCARDRARRYPIKGRGGRRTAGDPRVQQAKSGKSALYGVLLRVVDVHYYKDVLTERLQTPNDREERELWQESDCVARDYAEQMASEHKVLVRGQWVWRKRTEDAQNHLWDTAVYQCVGADLAHVAMLPRLVESLEQAKEAEREEALADDFDDEGEGWATATRRNRPWI